MEAAAIMQYRSATASKVRYTVGGDAVIGGNIALLSAIGGPGGPRPIVMITTFTL